MTTGDFAGGDQPARLDCGRCKAPAPEYFYFLHIFRKKFLFSHNFIAKQKKKKYIDNIAKQL